jgi:chondroitin AC lyase
MMKAKPRPFLRILPILLLAAPAGASVQGDMETVRGRYLAAYHATANAAAAVAVRDQLSSGGSWPDIDYGSTASTNWPHPLHMERIGVMARAYTAPQSAALGDSTLREAIGRALEYWFSNDFTNINWWYNEIGIPRQLAPTLLMLDPQLSAREREQGVRILSRAKIQGESQNLVWLTELNAQRGLLSGDSALVAQAYGRIAQEIRIFGYDGEGTQADWSFLQHRRCLYNHGYGTSFVIDGARIAALTAGTRYAFSSEKVQLLASQMLDGSQWMTRYRFADFGARGREFTRQAQTTAGWMITAADYLLQAGTGREAELEAVKLRASGAVDAPLLVGNRMFWRGDMMTHHREAFYASVRMFSSRLANTDFNGPENQFGHHLADGLTVITRRGSEYDGIYPVWNWQQLPGTTARQSPPLAAGAPRRENGTSAFAGGVSNGHYGIAGFDFERDGLRAKKAWFFLDRGFAALGAAITDLSGNPVRTTLNQTSRFILSSELSRGVWHDSVAYIALDGSTIGHAIETETGRWSDINLQQSAAPLSRTLFSAWIDHGARPVLQSYAYWVEPGITSVQARASSDSPPVMVATNNGAIQAVWDPQGRVGGAVMYSAGECQLAPGLTVSLQQPGIVLVQAGDAGGWRLWFADPTQRQSGAVIALVNGAAYHGMLPGGDHAGSSIELLPVRLEFVPGPEPVLRYRRLRDTVANIEYALESSPAPAGGAWTPVAVRAGTETVSRGPLAGDDWETVELQVDLDPPRFLRLLVRPD